jgi:uncharacterized protein (DUF2249 family)
MADNGWTWTLNREDDMATETTIDVRSLAPRERHPRIFATFDSMAAGDAILLINDHDPKPLFYQFQAERPGQVHWTPEEQGPERWVIRIEKVAAAAQDAVLVDVRDDVRAGREPFGRIMQAMGSLRDGQEMRLINGFEPVPLYDVMAERGFAHETGRLPDGDWEVRFFRQ